MPEQSLLTHGRRWKWLTLAFIASVAALAAIAPPGEANFTTGKCQGTAISGRGASFQTTAQTNWISNFQNNFCADVGTFPSVTYTGSGSGSGLQVMGRRSGACPCPPGNADGSQSRNQPERYAASDDPPNSTTVGQINQGTDSAGDEGTIHVIPVAAGSTTVDVNWPDNCDRSLLPDSAESDPSAANSAPFDDRVRFTRSQLEAIWAGDAGFTNWKDVFPTLASDPDCNVAITRVVRFDDSGTTFSLKDFLDRINTSRGWQTTYITPDTRTWPNASVGARADCGGATGPQGANLTSSCSNGNGALLDKLSTVDGGIGYSDLATARGRGYDIALSPPAASRDDDKFWIQVPNPNNLFTEATTDPNGFTTTGTHGSNCTNAQFTNVPASTLGSWFTTSGADSTNGAYTICVLTYDLAWDDYKGPYSLQGCGDSCEEQKARSVKDYLSSIVSDDGQNLLSASDYAPLEESILNISRTGVNAICWDKSGTGNCPPTVYAYPRPKGATPLYVQFVPAFNECTSPNRTHGAPLSSGSCNPPVQSSSWLTVGTPDANGATSNNQGFARYVVQASDVAVTLSVTDVRCRPGSGISAGVCTSVNTGTAGDDYSGQVQLSTTARITDKRNGTSGFQPATTQDMPFPMTVPCTTTSSNNTIGGTCSLSSSFNAVAPGAIVSGKRAIWQLGEVLLNDGGSDGVISTTPNTLFEQQGVFVP
jgi:ABC-type phosphate transport system substrate-binding protein